MTVDEVKRLAGLAILYSELASNERAGSGEREKAKAATSEVLSAIEKLAAEQFEAGRQHGMRRDHGPW